MRMAGLSMDARYCRPGDALTADALLPHGGLHVHSGGWDDIYGGAKALGPWRSTEFQRYWERPGAK